MTVVGGGEPYVAYETDSAADAVMVTVTDNDEKGSVVVSPEALDVPEGGTATYTVELGVEPTTGALVTVTIEAAAGDVRIVSPSPNSLNFSDADWDTPRTVTIIADEDDDAVPDKDVVLTHTVTVAAEGGNYDGVDEVEVAVTVEENDEPGVTVTATEISVNEGGENSFLVRLESEPSADVKVEIMSGSDVLTADPASLTFTASGAKAWNVLQTVTLSAEADDDADPNPDVILTLDVSGGDYDDVDDVSITVTVAEVNAGGLVDTDPSTDGAQDELTIDEGKNGIYSVVLVSKPSVTVTVTPVVPAGTDVTVTPAILTFTDKNWDMPQDVTVRTVVDADAAEDEDVTISHVVGGGYAGTVADVTVMIAELNERSVTVTPTDLTINEGQSGSYSIVLTSEPTGPVRVIPEIPADTDVTFSPGTPIPLTFSASNWNQPQTVTVNAAQDDDTATDDQVELTHAVFGGDYGDPDGDPATDDAVAVASVTVTITEDDTPTLSITPAALAVTEGGSANYEVMLPQQPSGEVTVTVTGAPAGDLTVEPMSLTFTMDNYATAQVVAVSVGEDDDADTDPAVTLRHDVTGGGYDAEASYPVTVTITDNDAPGVTVTPTALTLDEGGEGKSYTVVLATRPSGDVTVTVTASAKVTVEPASLTFSTSNWNQAQMVSVSGAQDDDSANDEVTLKHAVSGGGYDAVTAANVMVAVTDDDQPGVRVSLARLSVLEGESGTYTVVLTTQPTGDVTVTPVVPEDTDVTVEPASLTFTTGNWGTEQTVKVSAAADIDETTDPTVALTHLVTGADYAEVSVPDLDVAVREASLVVAGEVAEVTISVPDSGVVRGIDSLLTATVRVLDVPRTPGLEVVMYLVSGDKADTVVTENTSVFRDFDAEGESFERAATSAEREAELALVGTAVGKSLVAATEDRRPSSGGIAAGAGLVAVRKKVNNDKSVFSTTFSGDADSVTTKEVTDGVEFTWRVKVSSQVSEVKRVRVAAFVVNREGDAGVGDVKISKASQQFGLDGDRPMDPHAFENATANGALEEDAIAVKNGNRGVKGFDRGATTVLGIGDSLKMRLKLGPDVAAILGSGSKLDVAAVVFGKTIAVDKSDRESGSDVVRLNLILKEDMFGAGTEGCCAGDATAAVTDTLRFVYVDEAGNVSGDVNGPVGGAKATTNFLVDTKKPVLDGLSEGVGDTIIPVSDDTISDGTLNAGFPGDTNTVIWKLAESLDSLFVTFDGADVDATFSISNKTSSIDDPALLKGVDRILDFTEIGNLSTENDSVRVLGVDSDGKEVFQAGFTGSEANVSYKQRPGVKDDTDSLLTGLHTLKLKGRDFGGNLGPELERENVYVDVDDIQFQRLFPTKAGFGPVDKERLDDINEETAMVTFSLSEPADSVLITYKGIDGPDEDGVRTRRLSGSELTRTDAAQSFVVDSLEHGTKYQLTVLGRDIAGNFTQAGPDTFLYNTDAVVATIKRFVIEATRGKDPALPIGLIDTNHVAAGGKVLLTLTADATTDGERAAVTFKSDAILKVEVVGSSAATTGIALEGTGVEDMGGGRAVLKGLDWVTGSRTVTLTDSAAIETLMVSIVDSTTEGGPFAGRLDSAIVYKTEAYSQIVVSAADTVNQGEDFWVSVILADKFENPRSLDERHVSISANKLGVEIPADDQLVKGSGGFMANSRSFSGEGLVFTLRDLIPSSDEDKGDYFIDGESNSIYVKTPGEVIAGTIVDRPDTLIVEDYKGADGAGDQGGFLVLTWDLSDHHTPGGAYRIYREVHVNYAPAGDDDTTGAAVVELESPRAVPIPWAKIDMVPKEAVARAIVATLDNVASMWWVAAEVGGATSAKQAFGDVSSFTAFPGLMDESMVAGIASGAPVARVASAYELMGQAMVASKKAGMVDPDAPVFAALTPEALAYAESGVAPRLKGTEGDIQSSELTPSAEAVAAIDDIPPEPITYLRVLDTPGDAGASIDVVWAKSGSDRLISRSASGAIGKDAVSDIVPGVVGYNVYRKLSGGEFSLVGMAGAGETSFSDVTALNGVRYTYQVSPFDDDNVAVADIERTAMAIRNNVVDKSGSPIYGLFGPDQSVGFDDFFIFADFFGLDASSNDFDPAFDLSGNNKVDFDDFFVFADNFGRSVEAAGKAIPALAGLNPEASLFLETAAELPRVGKEMVVEVGLADFAELKGYGFTVNYDADRLEFVKVLGGAGILGETELAQPHVVAQGDGQVSLAAYGRQTVDKGELGLSLVFRPTMEIEDSRIYFSEGQLRDGNYGVNQVARLGEIQIQTRPEVFALADNYPNPFNPETTIKYALPEAVDVRLDIYNMLGQMVRTMVADNQSPGRYVVRWDATDDSGNALSTGIYFYRLRAGDFLETKKMLLLK